MDNIVVGLAENRATGGPVFFGCKANDTGRYFAEAIPKPYVEVMNDLSLNKTAESFAGSGATSEDKSLVPYQPTASAFTGGEQPPTTGN